MPKQRYAEDFRNYDREARELIKGLPSNQLYDLYEVVRTQQQRANTDERDKELAAVQKVIEAVPRLDRSRLQHIRRGFKGNMAHDARATDGNTKPNRKKV